MAIVVETGSGDNPNANSYVSEADLTAFAAARGITLTGQEDELLTLAMDYIESLIYQGRKKYSYQPLQWPRIGVIVDGYIVDSTTIPLELKNGQMQAAIAIDQGNDPLQDIQRSVTREKVGDLEVEYSDSSVTSTLNRRIITALRKLLVNGSGGSVMNVYRG